MNVPKDVLDRAFPLIEAAEQEYNQTVDALKDILVKDGMTGLTEEAYDAVVRAQYPTREHYRQHWKHFRKTTIPFAKAICKAYTRDATLFNPVLRRVKNLLFMIVDHTADRLYGKAPRRRR